MKTECLVVGASVIGGAVATKLSKKGLHTVILSDKPGVGKDGKCTSIISASGLPRTGINYKPAVLHEIFGANIRCGNAHMAVRRKEPVALVLNRFQLDELSVAQAQDAGAELKTSARFEKWEPIENRNAAETGKNANNQNAYNGMAQTAAGPIKTDYLIGADGIASNVARQCAFPALEHFVVAWEGEYESAALKEPDLVEVFLDIPGLFGWAVPAGPTTVRIGLATPNAVLLAHHKARLLQNPAILPMLKGAHKVREFHHTIPLRYRRQTQRGNVCLVGDAAGQVKATTGGGIVFGAVCAQELADAVHHHAEGGPLDYERIWRQKYAGALDGHRHIRKLMDFSPFALSGIGLRLFSALGGKGLLEQNADMDFIIRKEAGNTS